jgi:hypothetical protein
MDNDNPAEMSNEDLEKDMQQKNQENKDNQEHVSKSSASEGQLLDPSKDPASVHNLSSGAATELDSAGNIKYEGNQDGSMPDPEETGLWENKDTGDKMSG